MAIFLRLCSLKVAFLVKRRAKRMARLLIPLCVLALTCEDSCQSDEAKRNLGQMQRDGEFEVIGANSGEECFEILGEGFRPDVILLDLMMPGMDGWAVHDRLKKGDSPYSNIPIIFLTGATDKHFKEISEMFGEDYIEKPYDLHDLKQRIGHVLKKS